MRMRFEVMPIRRRVLSGRAARPFAAPVAGLVAGLALAVFTLGCAGLAPGPAWEEAPPPPATGPIVPAHAVHRATLPNGIRVIVLEDPRLPRVSLGVSFRRGAGSVAPIKAGIAEITAEWLQRGAGNRDALALAQVIEDVGASLSVSAGWDSTTVSIAGLAKDRALFEEILADVVLRPRFERIEFEKAKGEHLAALAAATDDPATLVRWHFLKTLYGDHRYGLPESGSRATVAKLTADDARAYWQERFIASNAVFWAVGAIDAKDFVRAVEARYAALPDSKSLPDTPPPPAPAATRRIVVVDDPDLVQAHILIGHEGIARTDPERVAIDLMNDALGGSGFSSRLMRVVRGERGLTYGISSGFGLRRQPGPFQVGTFTKVESVGQVVELVLAEMEAIRDARPVSEEELAKFVRFSVGSFGLSLETSGAMLSSLVDLDVQGLPEDSLDTLRARIAETTLEEVRAAARNRLHPERAAIVVLGPADRIVPQLEGIGTVEVVKP